MFDLSVYSIFRNSEKYLGRYLSQVEDLFELFPKLHFRFLTGDNEDNTWEILEEWRKNSSAFVALNRHDTGAPYYPSQDRPDRWGHLERVWNENLSSNWKSKVSMIVESDLFWNAKDVVRLIGIFNSDENIKAVAPMLWKIGRKDIQFYDDNGFRRNGKHFSRTAPFIPDYENIPFISVDTAGGMIITNSHYLDGAEWKNKCTLHFQKQGLFLLDTQTHIYHP